MTEKEKQLLADTRNMLANVCPVHFAGDLKLMDIFNRVEKALSEPEGERDKEILKQAIIKLRINREGLSTDLYGTGKGDEDCYRRIGFQDGVEYVTREISNLVSKLQSPASELPEEVSVKERLKILKKEANPHSAINAVCRALGFKEPYDCQQTMHGYNHLINFSDVEAVTEWMLEQGYDITVPKKYSQLHKPA